MKINMDDQYTKHRLFFGILVGCFTLFLLAVGSFFIVTKGVLLKNTSSDESNFTQTKKETPENAAALKILTKEKKNLYKQGETITFIVTGSSKNQQVTGYDVVIRYDPVYLKFLALNNSNPEFQVLHNQEDYRLMVTGFTQLQDVKATTLSQTPLFEINFQSQQPGTAKLNIEYVPKSTKTSNLTNNKAVNILESVKGTSVEIIQ